MRHAARVHTGPLMTAAAAVPNPPLGLRTSGFNPASVDCKHGGVVRTKEALVVSEVCSLSGDLQRCRLLMGCSVHVPGAFPLLVFRGWG